MSPDRVRPAAWAFLAIPLAVILATGALTYQLDTLKAAVYFLSLGLALVVFALSSRPRDEVTLLPLSVPVYFLFVCLSLVSLAWSRLVYETSYYLAVHCANLVLLFLAANALRRPRELALVLPLLAFLLFAVALVGILERLKLVIPAGDYSSERIISTMGNAGYLGFVLAVLIPAGCAVVLWAGSSAPGGAGIFRGALASSAPIAGAAALFFTGSRAGMVAAAVGIGCLGLILLAGVRRARPEGGAEKSRIRRLRILWAFPILLVIGLAAAYVAFSPAFFSLVRPSEQGAGGGLGTLLGNRLAAWEAALSIWRSEGARSILFGRGMGGYYPLGFAHFPSDYMLQSELFSFKHAHNEYLELLADGGLLSLLSWLALVALALRRALRTARDPETKPAARLLAAAIASGMAASLVQDLVDPSLRTPGVQALFYFIAGIAFAFPGIERGDLWFRSPAPARTRMISLVLAAAALLSFSLLQGYRYFRIEAALLEGFGARSMREAAEGFDKTLALDPNNVYALYEKMSRLSAGPKETIALAERIERVIPGFRQTALFKGMAQAVDGQYREASASLMRYLAQESFNVLAYAHLVASEVMLADTAAAAASFGDFFRARHRLLMRQREDYFDLTERELRIDLKGGYNRSFDEGGRRIALLSSPYLKIVAGILTEKRAAGFTSVLESVFVAMGSLYDELDYADVSLAYYDQAISMGGMDRGTRESILAKYRIYYEKARAALEAARAAGDAKGEVRARGFLKTYLGYILDLEPSQELRKEYQEL